MKKRKQLIFTIALCAIMAGLAIVLDKVSLNLGTLKFTFYALPLLVIGIVNGLGYGLITGAIAGIVLQLTSPYGITPSSPFWALAPIAWGGVSGLVKYIFDKKKIDNLPILVALAVITASVAANLVNTLAFVMDSLLVKDSYYTMTIILTNWPTRLLVMFISMIPYMIVTLSSVEAIRRSLYSQDDDEEVIEGEHVIEGEEPKEETKKKTRIKSFLYASFYLTIFTVVVAILVLVDILVNGSKNYILIFLSIDLAFAIGSLVVTFLLRKKEELEPKDKKVILSGIIIAILAIIILTISLIVFII